MMLLPEQRGSIGVAASRRPKRHRLAISGVLFAGVVSLATPAAGGVPASWSIVPSPNNGTKINDLEGVSCASVTSCTAVGWYRNGSRHETLIESWDGTSWSIVPSPNKGTGGNKLFGVSCVSASSCMAVGFSHKHSIKTLTESWDGTSWSIVPSPNEGGNSDILDGVSCTSPTNCVAVGYNGSPPASNTKTLIESWNGTSWSIVPSPDNGTNSNYLMGVSCLSASSCTAVGYNTTNLSQFQSVIESWDGTSWSIVPNDPNGDGDLLGVSCVSASSCTAVGGYGNASNDTNQTLIESWDGTDWQVVPSPNAGTGVNVLYGVSCVSDSACTAVGLYFDTGLNAYQTLVESWDDTSWSVVASPDNGSAYNVLSGVSCVPVGPCTAVGYYDSGPNAYQTLIESSG